MKINRLTHNGLLLAILIICSQLTIPLPFVPLTMQTFAVGLLASWLPWRDALWVTGGYLLLGACGLPVFANFAGGLGILIGPLGGYLFGFLMYCLVTGILLQHQEKTILNVCWTNLLGAGVQLLIGSLWMVLTNHFSLGQALLVGFVPFVIPGIIKVYLVSLVAVKLNQVIRIA